MDVIWNMWKDKTIYEFLLFMDDHSTSILYWGERNSFSRPSFANIYNNQFSNDWWSTWKQVMIYDKGWQELTSLVNIKQSIASQLLMVTMYDAIVIYLCNNIKYRKNIDGYNQISRHYFTPIQHNSFFNQCDIIFFHQISATNIDSIFETYSARYWICSPYGIIHDLIQLTSVLYQPMSIILLSKKMITQFREIVQIKNVVKDSDTISIYRYESLLFFCGYIHVVVESQPVNRLGPFQNKSEHHTNIYCSVSFWV